MKKLIIIIIGLVCLILSPVIFNAIGRTYTSDTSSSLPLLAGTCEIIGVGRVTNTWSNGKGITIAVDNYWRGDPGSNTVSILMETSQPPVTNTPIVFLVDKYYRHQDDCVDKDLMLDYVMGYEYRHIFRGLAWGSCCVPREVGMGFQNDERSWFHVNDTNSNLVAFTSNLVFAVNASNTNLFYETIRDGYRLHPFDSRIHEDSYFAFFNSDFWMTTNFVKEIWTDPLLGDYPRRSIYNWYYSRTGEFLSTNYQRLGW